MYEYIVFFSFMLFNEISRFLGEIKTDNFIVSNNENTTFGFSLFWTSFFSSILLIYG